MAKDKQKKKKERERRVAKKKHETALKRVQEKSDKEPENTGPQKKRGYSAGSTAKPAHVDTGKKSTFTQRRTGGG